MLILHPQLPVNTLLVLPHRRNVNVPPVRDRGLLRSCPRWTRPAQKCFLSESQDVFRGIGIPIQLASAFA